MFLQAVSFLVCFFYILVCICVNRKQLASFEIILTKRDSYLLSFLVFLISCFC